MGSVSGGCIEDDLIHRYARSAGIPDSPPQLVKYGVTADEAHRFWLPCGGTLELLLEFNPDAKSLGDLVEELARGKLIRRVIFVADGRVSLSEAHNPEPLRLDHQLVSVFGPEFRMLLIGAGQLSECLATMALFSGFAVTVCDPRDEYSTTWSLPGARLTKEMPDDAVLSFRPNSRSCIVALTHDPKLDHLALLEALKSKAFYVGAIGSRRNADTRRKRILEHFDLTEPKILRLRSPMGLYIGSKTPPEIAISVMAEITAVRNGVVLPRELDVREAKEALPAGSSVRADVDMYFAGDESKVGLRPDRVCTAA